MKGISCIKSVFATLVIVCVVCVFYLLVYVDKREITIDSVSDETAETIFDQDEDEDSPEFLDVTLKDYPNFPAVFYDNGVKPPASLNKTCAKFPTLDKIIFNNLYWQTLETPLGEYQLLGAYWDVRKKNKNTPTVRVLAMITPLKIEEDFYCQFWFNNKVILSAKVWSYFLWHEKWGGNKKGVYKPYLISCKVPREYEDNPPMAVSLVANPCDQASNILKIPVNIPGVKENFAVCVKGLDFHDDISIKLIEWIEVLKLLGAQKIFFYELHVHEEIRKILAYYEEEEGTIELTPITLPGHYPNEPFLQHLFLSKYRQLKRLHELISYNDCFLKHMYEYEYIVLLDIDEVIMPSVGNWATLIDNITSIAKNANKSSYNVRNVYFFDDYIEERDYFEDIPPYMHMLQHVYRMKNVMGSGLYIKSFHNTESVLALHNHYPLYCVEPCRNLEIKPEVAKLQHYRKDCVNEVRSCGKLKKEKVFDSTIWRFKTELIERVKEIMAVLNIER